MEWGICRWSKNRDNWVVGTFFISYSSDGLSGWSGLIWNSFFSHAYCWAVLLQGEQSTEGLASAGSLDDPGKTIESVAVTFTSFHLYQGRGQDVFVLLKAGLGNLSHWP